MKTNRARFFVAASLAITALAVSTTLWAEWTDAPAVVPATIPYQGTLEFDGELVDADNVEFWVRIQTRNSNDQEDAVWPYPGDSSKWERHPNVKVRNGRFALAIGGGEDCGQDQGCIWLWDSVIFDDDMDSKELIVKVRYNDNEDTFPPQRLGSVPYALLAHGALRARTVDGPSVRTDELQVSGSTTTHDMNAQRMRLHDATKFCFPKHKEVPCHAYGEGFVQSSVHFDSDDHPRNNCHLVNEGRVDAWCGDDVQLHFCCN